MPSPSALADGRWLKLPLPTLQPSNTIITAKKRKKDEALESGLRKQHHGAGRSWGRLGMNYRQIGTVGQAAVGEDRL